MIGGIYTNRSGKGGRYILRFKGITRRGDDLKKLERMLNGLRYEMDRGKFDPRDYQKDQPLSFTNVSEKWLDKQRDKKSWKKMRCHIAYAQQFFQDKNVKEIKYGDLEDFFDSPELKHLTKKSIHNIKTTLHTCWVWMCKRDDRIKMPEFPEISFELGWRKTIDKPTQDAILDKVHGKHTVIYLLDEDIELLRSMPRGFPKQYFFRHTGLRSGLKVTDLDQFGSKYLYKWWKKACDALNIEGVDLYGGTRHSTVTRLGQYYSPEEIMQDGSGHTTNKAFSRYFQRHASQKKALSHTARHGKGDTKVIRLNLSVLKDK